MITSFSNGRIKQLVQLRDKSRVRNREGLFLGEGLKMFEEAPIERLREVYVAENFWREMTENASDGKYGRVREKLKECACRGILVEQVETEVFGRAADTRTPQGILFVMQQLSCSLEDLVKKAVGRQETDRQMEGNGQAIPGPLKKRPPLFLLVEDIQDPGNLGTMLRTAEGAGADGVIMSRGTVDIYNPKTIRSTMGSLYRVPFLYTDDLPGAIRLLQQNGITVYAAHLQGESYYDEIPYKRGSAFLIGNEGNGLKEETALAADCLLKIPMEGKLESLNASIAAALLLYQAAGYDRRTKTK